MRSRTPCSRHEAAICASNARLPRTAPDSHAFDYAVMEKTRSAAVVPLDAGWSDVGSWAALHEVLDKDERGNVLRGNVIADDCRNCFVASNDRLVAVIGLEGCIVVETQDAVLVMPHDRAQDVKRITERLANKN
jgi:mannose-1-phosphate guanylyltransferase